MLRYHFLYKSKIDGKIYYTYINNYFCFNRYIPISLVTITSKLLVELWGELNSVSLECAIDVSNTPSILPIILQNIIFN